LLERGKLSDLFATSLVLIRGNKRTPGQREALQRALQLFVDDRLVQALEAPIKGTSSPPPNLLEILSMRLEDCFPRFVAQQLAKDWEREYVGELFLCPERFLKDTLKSSDKARRQLTDMGVPLSLDLDVVGWLPPYYNDPETVRRWNLRLHEVIYRHPNDPRGPIHCEYPGGCITIGEKMRRCKGRTDSTLLWHQLKRVGLKAYFYVPPVWEPVPKDEESCWRYTRIPTFD
jgi:hypothetical protein